MGIYGPEIGCKNRVGNANIYLVTSKFIQLIHEDFSSLKLQIERKVSIAVLSLL